LGRELSARNGRGELRALDARIELDEDLPLLHRCARFEADADDDTWSVRTDRNPLARGNAADGRKDVLPGLLFRPERGNAFRRWPILGHLLAESNELADLCSFDAREGPGDEEDGSDGDDITHRVRSPSSDASMLEAVERFPRGCQSFAH